MARWSRVVSGVIMLLGVAALLYPAAGDLVARMHASYAVAGYDEQAARLGREERADALAEARRYNRDLAAAHGIDVEEDEGASCEAPSTDRYRVALDVDGEGMMGYLSIPTIDVEVPIYHGADERVLQSAAGHVEGSSLPVGGEGTHAVIAGHRGLASARLFTDLDKLEVGDVFFINVLDVTLTYEVDRIEVVLPADVSSLAIEEGQDLVTLVTCTPYGVNTHRLLVRGHAVAQEGALPPDGVEEASFLLVFSGVFAGMSALAVVGGLRALRGAMRGAPRRAPWYGRDGRARW